MHFRLNSSLNSKNFFTSFSLMNVLKLELVISFPLSQPCALLLVLFVLLRSVPIYAQQTQCDVLQVQSASTMFRARFCFLFEDRNFCVTFGNTEYIMIKPGLWFFAIVDRSTTLGALNFFQSNFANFFPAARKEFSFGAFWFFSCSDLRFIV